MDLIFQVNIYHLCLKLIRLRHFNRINLYCLRLPRRHRRLNLHQAKGLATMHQKMLLRVRSV